MDGGTVWNVDPFSAINQCLEVVDSEEDIILDIAICSDGVVEVESEEGKTMHEFFRARQLHGFYTGTNLIADAQRAHPKVNYRHLFLEHDNIVVCLDFRNETTWPYQMMGRQDA